MKKLEKRAILCLVLAGMLLLGLAFFIFQYITKGDDWASFAANRHLYQNGNLIRGSIYDVDGDLLLENSEEGTIYSDSAAVRRATIHAVGDVDGNIGNGAVTSFADKLTGYNLITGTYSLTGRGRNLYLSIDDEVCRVANEALDGRSGMVGVYNYETGEVICMVSSPNYDPLDPPTLDDDDDSGLYLNRFLSGAIVPGSIFKLVTLAAAIDNKDDIYDWTYECTGELQLGDDVITCPNAHGTVDIARALSVSCNCAFGELTLEVGSEVMTQYVEDLGLTASRSINGINTAKGKFTFPDDDDASLAWAGIGQYEDLINPCTMLTYMGAIASGGRAVVPDLIHSVRTQGGIPLQIPWKKHTKRLISESTADELAELMHNNVVTNYGEGNYPGLDLCAKSGTAEVGGDLEPNAWFAGFLRNEDAPYAFIVLVENGGSGSRVAGSVANEVLQAVVNR